MAQNIVNTSGQTPTLAAKAAQWALVQQNVATRLVGVFNSIGQFCWGDPTQAQAAFDAFTSAGYVAASLFTNALAAEVLNQVITGGTVTQTQDENGNLVTTITGGSLLPSPIPTGWSYNINEDGTVTVVEPESSSE
jgi:hypothetical protein